MAAEPAAEFPQRRYWRQGGPAAHNLAKAKAPYQAASSLGASPRSTAHSQGIAASSPAGPDDELLWFGGATIEILDAADRTWSLPTNAAGNFYLDKDEGR